MAEGTSRRINLFGVCFVVLAMVFGVAGLVTAARWDSMPPRLATHRVAGVGGDVTYLDRDAAATMVFAWLLVPLIGATVAAATRRRLPQWSRRVALFSMALTAIFTWAAVATVTNALA